LTYVRPKHMLITYAQCCSIGWTPSLKHERQLSSDIGILAQSIKYKSSRKVTALDMYTPYSRVPPGE